MVRIIVLVLSLALALPAGAQTGPRITLDEAVALALRENRTLRAKQFEREATRASEITAGLRPNPVATYSNQYPGASDITHLLDDPHAPRALPAVYALIVGRSAASEAPAGSG